MRVKKITEVLGKKVYTDSGDYFGEIEEANLFENKIDGWRIRVSSSLASIIGGARGVVIPHQFVKAVSDIYSPIAGEIAEVNEELEDKPELLNQSPYENGWIFKIKFSNESEINEYMSNTEYEEYLAGIT